MNSNILLELQNIHKTFLGGKVVANNNISIDFRKGEVHAIVGENGSGKSTLMSIIIGLYKQEKGKILFEGEEVNMYHSGMAKSLRIGMVHQHFHLVSDFTILENILIGQEDNYKKFGILDFKKAKDKIEKIKEKYKIDINVSKKVSHLSVSMQQKVEILKVLFEDKKLIIFDEPTATLSISEIDELLKTVFLLKKEGKTIIFISHKLEEVKRVSDRISIFRKGNLVKTIQNSEDLDLEKISVDMIGELSNEKFKLFKTTPNKLLSVKNLNYSIFSNKGNPFSFNKENRKKVNEYKVLDNINFDVYENEIFGLAGVQGEGQDEIINIIAGLLKETSGEVSLYSDKGESNEVELLKLDIKKRNEFLSHIPINRFKHGMILDQSLKFNSVLTSYESKELSKKFIDIKVYEKKIQKSLMVDHVKIKENCERIVKDFNVNGVYSFDQKIRNLSGGNQQKFVVGREIFKNHNVLLAGHPTRGLDIKAIRQIYEKILQNSKGKATILYSLEISELLSICHRVAIIYGGKIVTIIDPRKKEEVEKLSRNIVGEF